MIKLRHIFSHFCPRISLLAADRVLTMAGANMVLIFSRYRGMLNTKLNTYIWWCSWNVYQYSPFYNLLHTWWPHFAGFFCPSHDFPHTLELNLSILSFLQGIQHHIAGSDSYCLRLSKLFTEVVIPSCFWVNDGQPTAKYTWDHSRGSAAHKLWQHVCGVWVTRHPYSSRHKLHIRPIHCAPHLLVSWTRQCAAFTLHTRSVAEEWGWWSYNPRSRWGWWFGTRRMFMVMRVLMNWWEGDNILFIVFRF